MPPEAPLPSSPTSAEEPSHFLREIVRADVASGKHGRRVHTRFPPEPNGYLHIGHAKSICLNFGLAEEFGGQCNLRFDDTNPETEDMEYVESIQRDVRWLGFDWQARLFFASDYFELLYGFAERLIETGKAYVCSLNEEQIREYRGTISAAGKPSPYRARSVEENLDLFRRMRAGEFPDGAHVLRAKIDMASPNMKLRDPLLYRIRHSEHYRRGRDWCIYPFYDFTHCLSDALEGITHSICTLEFENNRELYDWVIDNLELPSRPRQYEFARLNLTYTVMSKRKLLELVEGKHVSGWDDPRMLTLSGLRRRGVTPEAVRAFCDRIGVSKHNSTVEMELFEHSVRDDLNARAPRVLCVLRPLEVVIENFPEGELAELDAPFWPHDVPKPGSRKLPFSRVLYIERDDFRENPPKHFHRLAPGREVRLRHAFVIRCDAVEKNAAGEVTRLRCSYDPTTRGDAGQSGGRKVKGTIHWVSAAQSVPVEIRLYDRLFTVSSPGSEDRSFLEELNPDSLLVLDGARAEPSLAAAAAGERFQFERLGYFFVDPNDSRPGRPVFNRIVGLKDTWAKLAARSQPAKELTPSPAAGPRPAPRPAVTLDPDAEAFRKRHGLSTEAAKVLAGDAALARLFEATLEQHPNAKSVAAWIVNELRGAAPQLAARALPFGAPELAELVRLVDAGTISGAAGKEVLADMLRSGRAPAEIVETRGLRQIADAGALEPIIERVLAENADAVARYKAGNQNLLGAFVGMVMKATSGSASPKLVGELLRKKLG
jgi:glutaminyl-tRNA synthetase